MTKFRTRKFPAALDPYPSRARRSHTIDQVRGESGSVYICGRLVKLDRSGNDCFGLLEDESGSIVFAIREWAQKTSKDLVPLIEPGDFLQIQGDIVQEDIMVSDLKILAASFQGPPPGCKKLQDVIRLRTQAIRSIRKFFEQKNFLEIIPPMLVPYPNLEIHQIPFRTSYESSAKQNTALYLPSSPEYYLKRVLGSGVEKIFSITHSFRNGEYTALHHPEYIIIEWYRAYASYLEIMADTEELVVQLNQEINGSSRCHFRGHEIDLTPPWERLTMAEAFEHYTGIKPQHWEDTATLSKALRRKPVMDHDKTLEWEDVFLAVFLEQVEPNLGRGKPLLLMDYPEPLAALSKTKKGPAAVAERVELYMAGIELANGYTELNDPEEQKGRFQHDWTRKKELEGIEYPIDVDFLTWMRHGFPPAGGIALGLERLLMILTDQQNVHALIPFPLLNL
ncbi:EF-P lysine aminoacylase EpmA [candidate division CSSED10-310 bacterium]|uniref:EF-P lysine aminoacylase EpmA n=1 Tax=candidate division CSSED10-310 bacterium TaxID=2855610 RepID=A0ABV6YSU9_UNCC1